MMKDPIFVTKAFIPPYEEYECHLKDIFSSGQLTNSGRKHKELEKQLVEYLRCQNLLCVSNGTIALQLIYKLFEKGEIITTPYSYVATTNSILWEGFIPRFADIDPDTFCANPHNVEALINENTRAVVVTHVYGIPCDVEEFERLGKKYNLPIIYDAAHAFGVKYKGKSILNYGDFSTLSFHATKLFHTVEGGAIITKSIQDCERLNLFKSFGHIGDQYYDIGINGKMSELHAAMGLTILPYINQIIERRKNASNLYSNLLINTNIFIRDIPENVEYNYAYYPVIFENNTQREIVYDNLSKENIFARRYFYPSLNNLPFYKGEYCPVSESYAQRVLCLPLFDSIRVEDVHKISEIVNNALV